ncbi:MAG: hypothetical protein ACRDZ3_21970 [Acidimicrobiia bacterium]
MPGTIAEGAVDGGEMIMGNRLTLCVLVGALATAACGGADELSQGGVAATTSSSMAATTSSTMGDEPTTSTTMGEEAPAFEEGDADAVLEYELLDYRFEGPAEVEGHTVFFKAVNNGTEDHELEVLDANGDPLGEVEAMPPGEEGSAAIELEPGMYTLQCILETADGQSHRDLGMLMDLEVTDAH